MTTFAFGWKIYVLLCSVIHTSIGSKNLVLYAHIVSSDQKTVEVTPQEDH